VLGGGTVAGAAVAKTGERGIGVVAAFVIVKITCRPPQLPEVEVMTLAPGGIVSTVSADGELEARNQVDISAEIVARIEKVYVNSLKILNTGQQIPEHISERLSSLTLTKVYEGALADMDVVARELKS